MTERRAAAATLLSFSSTGHRCFQEEYLEYSPSNDPSLPPPNETRIVFLGKERRGAGGKIGNWRMEEGGEKRREKRRGRNVEMLRGTANLYGRREAADDIFHEA